MKTPKFARTSRTTIAAAAVALAALLTAAIPPASAQAEELPIVFVHGAAGSSMQYQSQAQRFASNGYGAPVRAFEYNSGSIAAIIGAPAVLDAFIDALLAETGAAQVYLVGHSLGTSVSNTFLGNAARAAKIRRYIGIDGSSNANCGVGNPNLDCMGIFRGVAGNVGGNNRYFNDTQTHVQVASSAESFAHQYEFFTGQPPATTLVVPVPPGQVELAGRSVFFPANSGTDGATLEIWEVNPATGHRKYAEPHAVFEIGASGDFGPVSINGQKHYEFRVIRADTDLQGAIYTQPFIRSNYLWRILNTPVGSAIITNTNVSDDHSAVVLIRDKEWWTSHPSGQNDTLTITTRVPSNGPPDVLEAPGDILAGIGNGSIGIHVHDDAATPGVSTLNLLPFFPTQAFQTGKDVYMPATEQATGTISFVNAPRGDTTRLQVINTPNWPSTSVRMGVYFQEYVQDVTTWGGCKKGKSNACK
jgi:pimeloyl-ACP methyl ester carboxylesterase